MGVPFKHGDQIVNNTWDPSDQKPFTYIGEKGFGSNKQYVFYSAQDNLAYHFTDYDADNWVKYVPGLKVGKTYRFNDTHTGNTYRILAEYTHPESNVRYWWAEVKFGDSGNLAVDPSTFHDGHVERLEEVTEELPEW